MVTRDADTIIVLYLEVIAVLQKSLIIVTTVGSTQEVITIKYVRFKVTTCLYFSPNNRARSLSTLIAVSVNKDAKDKIVLVAETMSAVKRQVFQFSFTTVTNKITWRGSETRPTQTLVTARLRSKSLDGELSEESLRRATMNKKFPINVVMDRKTFKLAINVNWPCISAAMSSEQYMS